jgi:hypothetical protein
MIKQIREKKKVTEVKEIVTGKMVICDCCHKEIYNTRIGKEASWYSVTTGHNDWGAESCESVEYKDYCSQECLIEAVKEYAKEYEYSNTASMNIEKNHENKTYPNYGHTAQVSDTFDSDMDEDAVIIDGSKE